MTYHGGFLIPFRCDMNSVNNLLEFGKMALKIEYPDSLDLL